MGSGSRRYGDDSVQVRLREAWMTADGERRRCGEAARRHRLREVAVGSGGVGAVSGATSRGGRWFGGAGTTVEEETG